MQNNVFLSKYGVHGLSNKQYKAMCVSTYVWIRSVSEFTVWYNTGPGGRGGE